MKVKRQNIKYLIELASDVKEADRIITMNYGFNSISEKIAFYQLRYYYIAKIYNYIDMCLDL